MQGAGKPFDAILSPFYSMHHRYYSVYWDYFNKEEWTAREAAYKAEKLHQQEIAQRTVDIMRIGEMQPERDHQLTASDNSYTGDALGRMGREARAGGFFAFDMKVDSVASNALLLTYIGDDTNRAFDILINGVKLSSVQWNGGETGKFYDQEYIIPAALTHSKTSINVKIVANTNKTAGRIFGVRIIKTTTH